MKCPYCGTENLPGESFCTNCGGYLDATATNAPTIIAGSSGPIDNTISTTTSTIVAGPGGVSRSLTPNSRLQNGRYVIDKILGQGGMGAALLARDTRVSNKAVVIKELISDNTDPVKRQEDVRNFEREVETLASIDHPLVPNVTDSFQEGSRYFMVQEYVAGENLEDRMERVNQPMPEREALAYASQVLDILDYLSQQHPPVVHRDIKPANIIIGSKDKRAHLVDFGIARVEVTKNAQRKQTSALGTPGYAPPEQYQGNADGRSDIYALAATLHHVLTNRDPRNYPPFAYPSVRSLNPQLSPEIERVLNRALTIDITKRYQNAASMKHDIDELLAQRFSVSGDTSSYTLGTSGPIGARRTQTSSPPPPAPAPPPIPISQPRRPQQQQYAARTSPASRSQKPATYPAPPVQQQQPPTRQRNNNGFVGYSFILLILVIIIIGGVVFVLPRLHLGATGGSTATATPAGNNTGIGVGQINGEPIGISDGTIALDTGRASGNGDLKKQAAAKLAQGDVNGAVGLWNQIIANDPNDAETLIYLENANIASSPHITLVIASMLSGENISIGREDLQGAYVAQKEFNDGSKLQGGLKVRLLIANAGSKDASNATTVANEIVQLAKADTTFVGMMGFPFTQYSLNAIAVLGAAHIPMVAPTASGIKLTGISPYFFRVCPSDDRSGTVGADYATKTLKAQKAVLFVDPNNAYTKGLADKFSAQFSSNGGSIVATETYTVGSATSRSDIGGKLLTDALSHNPDLIYFAGYAADLNPLLSNITTTTIPILGGDALYELGGYSPSARANLGLLNFTAFFYPDEWNLMGLKAQIPRFFSDYPNYFSGSGQKQGYGYTRPTNDNALAYDATLALLMAFNNTSGQNVTPDKLRSALAETSFQGASGKVSFDSQGNAADKAVVILKFNSNQQVQWVNLEGAFT